MLTDILGSAEAAQEAFERLRSQEPIIIEGKLADRHVQFHSIVEPKRGHLQAAIMATTESRRAQVGFEYTAGALSRAAQARDEMTGSIQELILTHMRCRHSWTIIISSLRFTTI